MIEQFTHNGQIQLYKENTRKRLIKKTHEIGKGVEGEFEFFRHSRKDYKHLCYMEVEISVDGEFKASNAVNINNEGGAKSDETLYEESRPCLVNWGLEYLRDNRAE